MWLALPPPWQDDSQDPQLSALPGTGLPSHKALAKLEEETSTLSFSFSQGFITVEFGGKQVLLRARAPYGGLRTPPFGTSQEHRSWFPQAPLPCRPFAGMSLMSLSLTDEGAAPVPSTLWSKVLNSLIVEAATVTGGLPLACVS